MTLFGLFTDWSEELCSQVLGLDRGSFHPAEKWQVDDLHRQSKIVA